MKYVLIDLERTIGSGHTWYWKSGCMGYTRDLTQVGRYSKADALILVSTDMNGRTATITEEEFLKLANMPLS